MIITLVFCMACCSRRAKLDHQLFEDDLLMGGEDAHSGFVKIDPNIFLPLWWPSLFLLLTLLTLVLLLLQLNISVRPVVLFSRFFALLLVVFLLCNVITDSVNVTCGFSYVAVFVEKVIVLTVTLRFVVIIWFSVWFFFTNVVDILKVLGINPKKSRLQIFSNCFRKLQRYQFGKISLLYYA